MTEEQIRSAIRAGRPFFGVNAKGEVMARYMPFAPVFQWKKNQILPMPLQGEDLLWWLKAGDEEDAKG